MPRLPIPEISGRRLSTQPISRQLDPNAASQSARGLQEISRAIGGVASAWQDAQDLDQTLTNQNKLEKETSDILKTGQEDTDYNNYEKYHTDLDKVFDSSLEGFTNSNAKNRFKPTANHHINSAKAQIDDMFRKKMISHTRVESLKQYEVNRDNFFRSGNVDFLNKQRNLTKDMFEKGFVNEEYVFNEDKRLQEWDYDRAVNDASINRDIALEKYKNDEYDVPDDRKDELLKEMKNVGDRSDLEKEISLLGTQNGKMQEIDNILDDPKVPYDNKALSINQAEHLGLIPKEYAISARRVIKSRKAINASTSTKESARVIRMIYDANQRFEKGYSAEKDRDYLKKLKDIKVHINDLNASGLLSIDESDKLRSELSTATKKKQSEATIDLLYSDKYKQADESFKNTMPSYMRDEALREYFYAVEGKTVSVEEGAKIANGIADSLNIRTREESLDMVDKVNSNDPIPNDEILSVTGYTVQDIEFTAQQEGMTVDEVYNQLRTGLGK